ncbi:MAG TPA: carboxypeptidase-like regulatory domain-containing protein, partial [Pyrinomonadaceae bacterium]
MEPETWLHHFFIVASEVAAETGDPATRSTFELSSLERIPAMRQRSALLALTFTLCCYFFFCAAATSAHAPQGHTIRGKVRSSAGFNVPRVTVNLESGGGALIDQTVTNNEGDFFFGGLDNTSYQITVSAPDYNPASERVEFVRNVGASEPGETRTV